jgi:hypothetical protein
MRRGWVVAGSMELGRMLTFLQMETGFWDMAGGK